MVVRYYSSVAPETTLSAGITNATTSIQVGSVTGFPPNTPYTLALDYEGLTEELVQVNAAAGTTLTVDRGVDGTSAAGHNAGARVRHVSSARDFADSRTHENSDNGVHGLAPGEDLVGTDKAQILSNKTLVNAMGSLQDVTLNNTGVNAVQVVGDGTATLTDYAFDIRYSPAVNRTFRINWSGATYIINPPSYDTVNLNYRLRVSKSNGTTDIFAVLSGGSVNTTLSNGVNGFSVLASVDDVKRRAYELLSNSGGTRGVIYTTGSMQLNNSVVTDPVVALNLPAAQSGNALQVVNSASATVASISATGGVTGSSLTTAGTTTTGNLTATGTVSLPITTANSTAVYTIASGWSLFMALGAKIGGMTTINIAIQRTGANITANANGNITPDVQIGTLTNAYSPHSSVGSQSMVLAAGDGASEGTVRINPDNTMDIITWTPGVTIGVGSGTIRFTASFPSS